MGLSTPKVDSFLERAEDPLNRFYRYPICHRILIPLKKTPITPNHITVLHTLISLIAASFLSEGHLFIAFVLYEVRLLLDGLDGALAREKQASSLNGRMLNIFGNFVAFVGLMAGSTFYLSSAHPDVPVLNTVVPIGLLVVAMAGIHDFYGRKVRSALASEKDEVVEQLLETSGLIHEGKASWAVQLAYVIDWIQLSILAPKAMPQIMVRMRKPNSVKGTRLIIEDPSGYRFGRFLNMLAALGSDNALFILHLGMLTGFYVTALRVTLLYGAVAIAAAVLFAQSAFKTE